MDNKEIKIYNADLGLDGTIEELLDWAYRYDSDYTDEALDEIAEQAKALGLPEEQDTIPVLVQNGRNRSEDTRQDLIFGDKRLRRGGNPGRRRQSPDFCDRCG